MSSQTPKIILYHYSYSPYSHKILWYLQLRNIPFHQCPQPPFLPRPDLSSLGVTYRLIPVLAIDNDVYVDTYLILRELERRFPEGRLGAANQDNLVGEMEAWADKFVQTAAMCLPASLPLMKDARFLKDRAELNGRSYDAAAMEAIRPAALSKVTTGFSQIEEKLSTAKTPWLTGESFTLVDLVTIWPLEWIISIPDAVAGSNIDASTYPLTFAWISRFTSILEKLPTQLTVVPVITGPDATDMVLTAAPRTDLPSVGDDVKGAAAGDEVEVLPVDSARNYPQKGVLRGLDSKIVVLEVRAAEGGKSCKVWFPRRGYEVRMVPEGGKL